MGPAMIAIIIMMSVILIFHSQSILCLHLTFYSWVILTYTIFEFLKSTDLRKQSKKGLYLAGQDVVTPGITGALMGGILAAAAINPRVFRQL